MVQILQNLIANAIKFHRDEEPPVVHISAGQEGKEWIFSVNDNGIGMDPELFGRLFNLFQRLHPPDKYPGTGVGLAVTKKIVQRHGGRIWVESHRGKGPRFISVCRRRQTGNRMAEDKGVDILLVEDNLGDVRLITDALADTDMHPNVHCVRDGIEAIQFLRRESPFEHAPNPAIILLDLNLPRKDGRAVLADIKSDPVLARTPVIVLSGSDAPQDISVCYSLRQVIISRGRGLE